ncbi:YSIRK-type signal peptide-containing protein [Dolosigranulum pigrum]|uniref:YSIRK family Gram-positive signal peptide n=1 Tax=Dolosigranulum pigrum ATCC 51524 TaxID=883103 RepID=H3NG68_9LACT|nr:YSIRK-type signal peptide-containing protein [Dolosigranulum pigrum]EHR31981.1 YSIRK family Gram-positive signal peptide [Dolosigranulum pigrum ATCC 51524]
MVGKNNKHVQLRQEADKQTRFSLKKLTVGVASIAIGATLLLGQPISVNAEEPSTTQTDQSLGEYKEVAKKDLADKKIENEHLNSLIDSAESKEAVDKLVANYTQPEIATEDTDDIKDLKLYKAAKIAALKAKDIDNETALKTIEDAETKEAVDKLFKELDAKVEKPADETTAPTETEDSAPTQAAESTETEATEEPKVADQATESIPDEVTLETEEDDDYAEAVRELNDLNLSDTIKEDFAQKIKAAEDNKEAVSQILTEAIDLAELNTKKDAALVEIDQTNLHVDDSNELKGRIEVAASAEEVDNVLVEAQKRAEEQANQAQNGEATTEEKPEAQTKPVPEKKPEEAPKPEEKKPETDKKPESDKKPAPEKKPDAGQKPEAKKPEEKKPEVKKPEDKKPEAKKPDASKQPEKGKEAQPQKPEQKPDQQKQPDKSADKAAQDKKEQELKMAAAKDEAKKEINNLANLSDKQKGELLAGIDKADTPAKIGEIIDFARKLNQDQAPKQQKKQGERLPDTATGAWVLGLIGATAILAGFGIKKFKK